MPDSTTASPPPGPKLYQLAIGHYVSRALALATKLGVADVLGDERRTAEELAQATDTDASALRRVLRLLVAVGVVEEDAEGRFGLTQLGGLLREDADGSMKAMVTVFAGPAIQDGWKELEYCVRTGKPAFTKHNPGGSAFDAIAADPEMAANFDKAMATFAPQTAAAVAAAYDFSVFGTLADIGGGNGALLLGILGQYGQLRGIVFDQPHVAERARAHVRERGLTERVEVVGGSFFERVPAGADAYLLKHVIHDWSDSDAIRILRVCREAMPAHAKLLLVEGVYPTRIDASPAAFGAAANDVNMLVSTGGRQRSERELRQLYSDAGFELTRIVPTQARVSVIEGTRR